MPQPCWMDLAVRHRPALPLSINSLSSCFKSETGVGFGRWQPSPCRSCSVTWKHAKPIVHPASLERRFIVQTLHVCNFQGWSTANSTVFEGKETFQKVLFLHMSHSGKRECCQEQIGQFPDANSLCSDAQSLARSPSLLFPTGRTYETQTSSRTLLKRREIYLGSLCTHAYRLPWMAQQGWLILCQLPVHTWNYVD